MIIDVKSLSNKMREDLKARVEKMERKPMLAVIQVGDDFASSKYVRNKEKACKEVGILTSTNHLKGDVDLLTMIETIEALNNDEMVDGILVQLPLPEHLNERAILDLIRADKDVDGITTHNEGELFLNTPQIEPCTPRGVIHILDSINYTYEGANAVVIGRSNLVGLPMAKMLLDRNCSVEVCHSHTKGLIQKTKRADLVVSAVGKAEFLSPIYFAETRKQVLIDVGISHSEEGKVVGDISRLVYDDPTKMVTPVPGGVGVMTITTLLENVVRLAEIHNLKTNIDE